MSEPNKSFFEKNLSLFKKNHPEIFKIISKEQEASVKTELVLAKNQKPNLRVEKSENEWIFIHDYEDPGIESEAFLSIVGEDSTGVVLMLGMGLGYSVLELLKKRKKIQYMIVFELNVEFFIQALKNIDLTEFFMDKRVMICLGETDNLSNFMAEANRSLMLENIHTLNLQSCFRVNPAYEKLSSRVFDYINAFNTDGATKTAHGRTFFENRLKHLTSMHHDKKLEDLAGKFKGTPAIIIAAGPSLDKNIDQIASAMGKAVIIAVDTALPNLIHHGITPDFITSIDYNELTYEKISGSASNPAVRQTNLICTSWVASSVTKKFPANTIFWAFNSNPLENWINSSLEGRMTIGGAGTVAHLNYISAKIMGCDPVIFVGQDLAFSNRKGHSSNVVLSSDEKAKEMLESGQDIMWVRGVEEAEVPTNRQMYGYKRTFEQMIKESGGKVINSTEGGASIEGAENIPLVQAIERFCKVKIYLDFSYDNRQDSPLQVMESTIKKIKELEKIIQKAEKMGVPIHKQLIELRKRPQGFTAFAVLPEKLRKTIFEFETCHHKADKNPLWPLFDEMTMEGLRLNEREKQEIEKLEGVPDKYLDWLIKSVERIDKVNKIRIRNLGRFKKQLNELVSYYKNEKLQLEQVLKDGTNMDSLLKLARLYYQSGDYVLLEKILTQSAPTTKDVAPIHYYYGIIALHHGDYEAAENRFQSAVKYDKTYAAMINKKRNEIGDNYWELATSKSTLRDFGHTIIELLLFKGLKCCPGHEDILNEFRKFAEDDLELIKKKIDSNRNIIGKWINFIECKREIQGCLKKETIRDFYFFYGKCLIDEGNHQEALNHYQRALSIIPDSPDMNIALADLHFVLEDFDSGLQYLRTAVSLDKQYAVYWYNMGKNLESQNDFNGAILAYEQYFIAKPEEISVLKEIGGCHTKLGNLEAALEAFEQLRKLELKK